MRDRIEKLINITINTCIPWVVLNDGVIQFIDPLEKKEISAHYGTTHMAVSLIIYGEMKKNEVLINKGEELLFSVLDRWNESKELPGFHNDFNNFALCVLDSYTDRYHQRIKETVMGTRDTVFNTVNWLPMRWFVNKSRYKWTKEDMYLSICEDCARKIRSATYSDGFIDDMLPKGRSFSLQYDIATVAFMQYLRVQGESIDISAETGALLNAVCPDGDINYMGRGTNQIFAWGLWIYLLASSGQKTLDSALSYLENRLSKMLINNNIMLNDYPGNEKYMWWDYHYCSVYTAHLLFWLIMTLNDYGKKEISPRLITDGSSGVHVYRNHNSFVVSFDGRTEYLAESGPSIAAIWTERSGVIYKGSFGPWYGLFGNRYNPAEATIRNHWGFFKPCTVSGKPAGNILSRILMNPPNEASETICPYYIMPAVELSDRIKITYHAGELPLFLNLPVFGGTIRATADGKPLGIKETLKLRNQYGWVTLKQQVIGSGKTIEIEVL